MQIRRTDHVDNSNPAVPHIRTDRAYEAQVGVTDETNLQILRKGL